MWQYVCQNCGESKGGVAISKDGSKIIASIGEKHLLSINQVMILFGNIPQEVLTM